MAKYVRGIDVAGWEPNINWEKVCAQEIHFAFIKATQADFSDRLFESHWNGAKRVGILRGAYHFIDPRVDGRVQAEAFLRTVRLEPGDLPPVLDLEDLPDEAVEEAAGKKGVKGGKDSKGAKGSKGNKGPKGGKLNASDVPNAKVVDCAQTWLAIVERETGRKPILYSSPSFLQSRMSNVQGKPPAWSTSHVLWLANYLKREVTENDSPFQPQGWSLWSFWQYSDRGLLDGIMTEDGSQLTGVDLNFFRGTLDQLRALAGATMPDGPVIVSPKKEDKIVVPDKEPEPDFFKYLIKSGDSLFGIALRFHTTVPAIQAINPQIMNANFIRAGDVINIPH